MLETRNCIVKFAKYKTMQDCSEINNDFIRTIHEPFCYLCGFPGEIIHNNLTDSSSCASQKWTLKRCSNPACQLIWLDPMPAEDNLWKAYRNYFTHADYVPPSGPAAVDWWNFLLLKIHKPLYKLFEHLVGLRTMEKKWRKKSDIMFLENVPPQGKLLDVGCGRGELLMRMSSLGWHAEGLEVDAQAAEFARAKHGLTIYNNTLENQHFPPDSFAAITMNHVIEHVIDPLDLLRECFRILKPGGHLVLATPNIDCLGHIKYDAYWAHLDPPRHLRLFTKRNLQHMAVLAGFHTANTWCTPGYAEGGAIRVSIERRDLAAGRKRREFLQWLEASYLKALAYYFYFVKKNDEVGEEIFLKATKD